MSFGFCFVFRISCFDFFVLLSWRALWLDCAHQPESIEGRLCASDLFPDPLNPISPEYLNYIRLALCYQKFPQLSDCLKQDGKRVCTTVINHVPISASHGLSRAGGGWIYQSGNSRRVEASSGIIEPAVKRAAE